MPAISPQEARLAAVLDQVTRAPRAVKYPTDPATGGPKYISEIYGSDVFTLGEMQKHLPKSVFASFVKQLAGNKVIDKPIADAIAHAVRIWAMDRGATHFTHWFQPMTDTTAEKHDSFLTLKSSMGAAGPEWQPVDAFSGSQLLQAEPDASSFPNGGTRATFEARGYTVWDATSPMFLQDGGNGTKILYIPSVFISYNGEALDEKTVHLRSVEAINKAATKLLHVLGHKDVRKVSTTLGTEQEFFLIDRALYALRPDLKICGRTLCGSLPAKHQQLEDHYFGRIPSRVSAAISECELELYKLGVPIKTRHNEVAPAQFEMAPIFEDSHIAVDHNMLTMDVLHRVAHRHKLKVLFHEKPFAGINGSGKHCNWSMSTDTGINLLDPTSKPEDSPIFLFSLVACINAVFKHSSLLRCGIASASNDHRLGGNEAPPSIISVFLGAHLDEVLNAIEEGRDVRHLVTDPMMKSIKVGGRHLDVKVATLPDIERDSTDRNRTSPFAFTGNKFEFRAVGSKQSPSFPVTLLNAAIASSLREITAALEVKMGSKAVPDSADIKAVLKHFITKTKAIRFEGDGYSAEWHAEAAKRGLPNAKNATEAFRALLEPHNEKMLMGDGGEEIFTKSELHARYHILAEKYTKDMLIEGNTLKSMVNTHIVPAVFEIRKSLAESVVNLKTVGVGYDSEKDLLKKLGDYLAALIEASEKLGKALDATRAATENMDVVAAQNIVPAMSATRAIVDALESAMPDKAFPFPKYTELLFSI